MTFTYMFEPFESDKFEAILSDVLKNKCKVSIPTNEYPFRNYEFTDLSNSQVTELESIITEIHPGAFEREEKPEFWSFE